MYRREDFAAERRLQDPDEARLYIRSFDWFPLDPPKWVMLDMDEKIYLDNMTDEEAVVAAIIIFEDVEMKRVEAEKTKYLKLYDWWGH